MGNKYLKYALLCVVFTIWGIVIFKFVHGFESNPATKNVAETAFSVQKAIVVDSFTLFADYDDPFIPETDSEKIDSIVGSASLKLPIRNEIKILDTLALKYVGFMVNPNRKRKVAIINWHGVDIMVKERQTISGLKIKEIRADNLQIVCHGQPFLIKRAG